jgi:hypothetical protein
MAAIPRLALLPARAADLVRRLMAQRVVAALVAAQEMGDRQRLETETLPAQARLKETMAVRKAVLSAAVVGQEVRDQAARHH